MIRDNDEIWFASLQEVRRQVKHIADTTGLGSQHEGQTRLFSRDENDWEVRSDFRTPDAMIRFFPMPFQ